MRVKDAREWAEIRARGKQHFLLMRGVVGRGLPLGLLLAVVLESYLGGRFPEALTTPSFLGRVALCVGVFSASGMFNAHLLWGVFERRFGAEADGR